MANAYTHEQAQTHTHTHLHTHKQIQNYSHKLTQAKLLEIDCQTVKLLNGKSENNVSQRYFITSLEC